MDRNLYHSITTPLIFGIWLYLAVSGARAYARVMKSKGISPFMTRKDLREIKDPEIIEALNKWKSKSRQLFLIWVITSFSFLILSMIIDKTIGFTE
jgi:hypothetical protein